MSPSCSSQYDDDDDDGGTNRHDDVISRNSNFANVSMDGNVADEYAEGMGRVTSTASTTRRRERNYKNTASEKVLESRLSANQELVESLRERILSLEAKHKEKHDVIKFLMKQMNNPDFVMQLSCTKSK